MAPKTRSSGRSAGAAAAGAAGGACARVLPIAVATIVLLGLALAALLLGSRQSGAPAPSGAPVGWERFEEKAPDQRKATLVYYSMDGCPHCVKFESDWAELEGSASLKGMGIETVKYETPTDPENHASKDKVDSYPTIMLKTADGANHVFRGSRSAAAIEEWAKGSM